MRASAASEAPPQPQAGDVESVERVMARIDQAALSSSTFEELMARLIDVVPPVVGAETCGVMLALQDRGVLQTLPGSYGLTEAKAVSSRLALDDRRSGAARVFKSGRTAIFNDTFHDTTILRDYVRIFGMHRTMVFPLRVGDRPVGILQVANRPVPFAQHDVDRIETLLPRIATAVEHVRKVVQLRRKESLESVLSHMALGLASGQPLEHFLGPVFEELCTTTHARIAALSGVGAAPFILHKGELDAELSAAFLAENERDDDVVRAPIAQATVGDPGWAAIHVPVLIAGRRVASISLMRRRSEPFSADERIALSRLASLAALAWATDLRLRQQAEVARLRERQRIADDLHDHVAQILFSGKIELESLLEFGDLLDGQRVQVERSFSLLTRGEQAIREVIYELAQPEPDDIGAQLIALVDRLDEEFSIGVRLELGSLAAGEPVKLSRAKARLIVKTAREGIVNAAKHAGPCRISVSLRVTPARRLLLTVWDDGLGAPMGGATSGYGLAALRRDARQQRGCLRLTRGRCGGTKLTISVPL